MAFYGRITNNQANASMTFDKVYPNRVTMDANADIDGVFTGRFVLVEYDHELTRDSAVSTYLSAIDAKDGGTRATDYATYCADVAAAIEEDSASAETVYYNNNYKTDKLMRKNLGRGYDSTVWRKVIAEDGTNYYVMLAELNSVVPSFTVEAEAPSSSEVDPNTHAHKPIKPHFDEDSTNVLYNLHVGAPWSFRIKPTTTDATQSTDPGTWDADDTGVGAIYFNRDGFSKSEIHYSSDSENRRPDIISIKPTGYSNEIYYDHDQKKYVSAVDTQEMVINLPTIGDAVAEVWDRLYGDRNAYKSKNPTLADDEIKRNTEVGWSDVGDGGRRSGLRLVNNAQNKQLIYTPEQINNVSGALNSIYDLIGQNIARLTISNAELTTATSQLQAEHITNPTADEILARAIQNRAAGTDENIIYYCTNNSKFYFKDYEVTIEALTPGEDDEIISKGSSYEQVVGAIHNPAEVTEPFFTRPTELEDYIVLGEDEQMQPGVTYYVLKYLDDIVDERGAIETTDIDYITLRDGGALYYVDTSQSSGTYLRPVGANAEYDSTKTYWIINGTGSGGAVTPRATYNYFPAAHAFVTYNNVNFTTYPNTDFTNASELSAEQLINLAKTHIFFERIVDSAASHPVNPDGSIDYSQTIYTTTLKAVAISRELSTYITSNQDFMETLKTAGFDIAGKPIIDKWPNTNADVTNLTGIWLKKMDANNKPYYYITKNSPQLNEYNNPSTNPVSTVLSGIETYDLELTSAAYFYTPNTDYWGIKLEYDEETESELNNTYRVVEAYRKITVNNNDNVPTYKITQSYNPLLTPPQVPIIDTDKSYPAVNGLSLEGLGQDTGYIGYFIPNQLYKKIDDNHYQLLDTYEDTTFYKNRSVVVKSDPLGQFNEGEVWNTELNIEDINENRPAGKELVLGLKSANAHLYELSEYSRTTNTLNGWILFLNKFIGVAGDKNTRDRNTVQGLINYLNDRLNKIDNIGANQLVVSDVNSHLNGAELIGDAWIKGEITTDTNTNGLLEPKFTLTHLTHAIDTTTANDSDINTTGNTITLQDISYDATGHITANKAHTYTLPYGFKTITGDTGTITASNTQDSLAITTNDNWLSTSVSANSVVISHNAAQTAVVTVGETQDVSPHFGESFKVLEIGTDNKGHVSTITGHSVTMPTCTLTDTTANGADVITQLTLNASTGAFNTTRANIGSLLLTDYTTTSASTVSASDTLNTAIAKLQAQITANDSANLVNNFTTTSTGNVMTTMALNNGTITGSYNNIGALQLTGYDLTNNGTVETAISANDTLNTAIQRLEYRLNGIEVPVIGAVIHGSNPSDIVDLVQSDGMIVLNRASASSWGLVKLSEDNEPGAGYVVITGQNASTNSDVVCYVPNIQDNGAGTIRAKWLPDASTASKGAVIVDDVITDSSTNPAQSAAIKAYVDEQITNVLSTLGFRTETYDYIDDSQSGGADYQAHDTGSFTLTASSINGYTPVRVIAASIDDNLFHITSTSVVETTDEVIVTINYEVLESYSTQSDPSHHATVLFEINS